MNSIRCQLLKQYPEAIETFGCVTKANRLSIGIEKDHHLDACVIASQGLPITIKTNLLYLKKSVSKGDFQQTKGIRSEQPITTVDILPRINPWDSLDYNNITTPYRSGYSMIFQDLATVGVPHLGWYFLAAGQMPMPVYLS